MTEPAPSARRWLPLFDTLTAAAVTAWIGGIFALGAFTARIVFRDLPRGLAAPTMSTIFRSFDGVIVACVVVIAITTGLRLITVGLRGRADRIALVAGTALTILGALDVGWVHPSIERMFLEGRTGEPAFAALHTALFAVGQPGGDLRYPLVGAHAWARTRE